MQIYLETGINKRKQAISPLDSLVVDQENKINNEIKNQQYQHNGKGTIVFKKGVLTQRTRCVFNNDKIVSS